MRWVHCFSAASNYVRLLSELSQERVVTYQRYDFGGFCIELVGKLLVVGNEMSYVNIAKEPLY